MSLKTEMIEAALDELCSQGWDEWQDAQEELHQLLRVIEEYKEQVEEFSRERKRAVKDK